MGLLTDFGGTFLFRLALAVYLQTSGLGSVWEMLQAEPASLDFAVVTWSSCSLSVLGGYVGARMSRNIRASIVQALITMPLSLLLRPWTFAVEVQALYALLMFGSVAGGAYLALRRPTVL